MLNDKYSNKSFYFKQSLSHHTLPPYIPEPEICFLLGLFLRNLGGNAPADMQGYVETLLGMKPLVGGCFILKVFMPIPISAIIINFL